MHNSIREITTKHLSYNLEQRATEVAETSDNYLERSIIFELLDALLEKEKLCNKFELELKNLKFNVNKAHKFLKNSL